MYTARGQQTAKRRKRGACNSGVSSNGAKREHLNARDACEKHKKRTSPRGLQIGLAARCLSRFDVPFLARRWFNRWPTGLSQQGRHLRHGKTTFPPPRNGVRPNARPRSANAVFVEANENLADRNSLRGCRIVTLSRLLKVLRALPFRYTLLWCRRTTLPNSRCH